MEFLMWALMTSTIMFIFMKHPMSMGLILLIQTMCISLNTSFMSTNSWFSYILFLVMIGGMLILFIYMTSVASNEMFKYSNILMIITIGMSMIMMISIFFKNLSNQFEFLSSESFQFTWKEEFPQFLTKFLSFPSMMMWLLLIIYLLITMIAVVKISMMKYGPLQQQS